MKLLLILVCAFLCIVNAYSDRNMKDAMITFGKYGLRNNLECYAGDYELESSDIIVYIGNFVSALNSLKDIHNFTFLESLLGKSFSYYVTLDSHGSTLDKERFTWFVNYLNNVNYPGFKDYTVDFISCNASKSQLCIRGTMMSEDKIIASTYIMKVVSDDDGHYYITHLSQYMNPSAKCTEKECNI